MPSNLYVADIRQGPQSLYDTAIVTTSVEESAPVEVTIAPGGGTIRGMVSNAKGQPAIGRVVLVPQQNWRGNLLLYRRGIIQAQTGQFSLNGIAPGDYKLFAWENLPTGTEEVPDVLAGYEAYGRSISIQAGALIDEITLEVIPYTAR